VQQAKDVDTAKHKSLTRNKARKHTDTTNAVAEVTEFS